MDRLTGCAPEHICDLFRNSSGCVEMVNSRGIYLHLNGKRILLCHYRYGTVPNGIALTQWDTLYPLFAAGQPVQIKETALCLPSGVWELQLQRIPKDTRVLYPSEESLRSGIAFVLAHAKETGLSSLAYPLFTGETPKLNLYCQAAAPHIQALLQAIKEENAATIHSCVGSILGLGPGLTPSGDDLLSGLLYGLRHSSIRDGLACTALTGAIRELAPEQTNAVSADYLLAMADDAPFDRMAAAWADLATGAAALMEIGNNSGSEMLLGLICAAALVQKSGK